VRPEALEKCIRAVNDLVNYVKKNEPKTLFYIANQEVLDATKFFHNIVFEDEIGLKLHQSSHASAKFVETVYPEALKPLEFQEYNVFAAKTEGWKSL